MTNPASAFPDPREHPSMKCDALGCAEGNLRRMCKDCNDLGVLYEWTCRECDVLFGFEFAVPDPILFEETGNRVCHRCAEFYRSQT